MASDSRNHFLLHRLPWIIAVVAVLVLAVTLYRSRETGAPQVGSSDEALERIMARLEALEAREDGAGAAGQGYGASPPGSRPTVEAAAARARARILAGKKTPEQQVADRARQLKQLEAQFSSDAADRARGTQMEDLLEKLITSPTMASTGMKPDAADIDCRAHVCRISATFAKAGDAQDWAVFYFTAAGANLSRSQVVFLPQPGGGSEVRIFATRNR